MSSIFGSENGFSFDVLVAFILDEIDALGLGTHFLSFLLKFTFGNYIFTFDPFLYKLIA